MELDVPVDVGGDDDRDRGFTVPVHAAMGDVRVHVWPAADGGVGRPVLLCHHGWTDSGEVFAPLASALGRRWTVVAPDAPGHGGTAWAPQSRYRVADHALTALAVFDRLPQVAGRRSPVVVLGHSMGALTATRLAVARPEAVAHLVLEDPARTAVRRGASAASMRARTAELQQWDQPALMARARKDFPCWARDEFEPWARSKLQMSIESMSVPVDWGEPLVELLADAPVPVTLVHGALARGGMVSPLAARRCAAACRAGCDVVALDCGHNPRREAREPFIAVVAAILGHFER